MEVKNKLNDMYMHVLCIAVGSYQVSFITFI